MPVVIEAGISAPKRRAGYLWLATFQGMVLSTLLSWPLTTHLLWFTLPFLGHFFWSAEYRAKRIRLALDGVQLSTDTAIERFQWHGEGRLSHAFMQLELSQDDGQRLTLTIWQDSVSAASWRALNMGFRVMQPTLRAAQDRQHLPDGAWLRLF
ncbi:MULTISPECIES: protein YgfX [Reinekea]|jgi:hypothetical protein|uniref:protein YgfX n=1 Tax=Reinekea TaxID=230494 RepID=UPI002352772B|nr:MULTISPECIES: protein YgfX [Reinekea]MDO7642654.1 hypothetical protein [Reinekea forsetii]